VIPSLSGAAFGSGVTTALSATINASGGFVTANGTATLSNKSIIDINNSASFAALTITSNVLTTTGVFRLRNTNSGFNTAMLFFDSTGGTGARQMTIGYGNASSTTYASSCYILTEDRDLYLSTSNATVNATNHVVVKATTGLVGIGTASPSERLTVSGNISASGTVIASNYNPAANVATFLATPTSANLAAVVSDETGSGLLVFGTAPTISSPTINTALTLNATSFTFGANSRENFITKLSNRSVYKNEVIPYAEIFEDFPTHAGGAFGTHRWLTNAGTVAYYTGGGPTVANFWGAISLTTGTVTGNGSNIYLGWASGANGQTSSRFNLSFQTCFCLNTTSSEYRQSYAGGGSSYAVALIADTGILQLEAANIGGAGVNTLTVASGLSISTGTFIAGTRYRLFFKPLSLTQCEVYFASAPWNSSTWTTLVDTTVTHPSVANSSVCSQPFVSVATKLNPGAAVAYIDWVALRQEVQR
jgi:hypothetical protein